MDNVIDVKIIGDSSSLEGAGARSQEAVNKTAQAALASGFYLQTFTNNSIQAAIAQEQLAAAATKAAADIPKIIPPAEAASFSFRKIWESAKEVAIEVKESMDSAGESVVKFSETTRLGTANAISSFSVLGATLGGAAIIGVLGEMVDKAKQNVVSLKQLSDATGVEIETLVGLKQEMIQTDTPTENLNQTISRLAGAMTAARDPQSRQAEAFRELGISTKGWANELPPTINILQQLASHLANSTNETADLGNAKLVLGRNIVQLVAMLKAEGDNLTDNIGKHKDLISAVKGSTTAGEELAKSEAQLAEKWNTMTASTLPVVVFSLNLIQNGLVRITEATQVVARETEFFNDVAHITYESVKDAIQGTAFGAMALAAAIAGNVSAAVNFQEKSSAAFALSRAEMGGMKSLYDGVKNDIIATAKEADEKVRAIWEQPLSPKKNFGDDNTDFINKNLIKKQREAQDEELVSKQNHQIAVINTQRAFYEALEKMGNISDGMREVFLRQSLDREEAIRIEYANRRIALFKDDPESADKVAKLEGEKLAAIDKAVTDRIAASGKIGEANRKMLEGERKEADEIVKNVESWVKESSAEIEKYGDLRNTNELKIALDHFRANQMIEVAEQEHQIRMLKLQEEQTLAALRLQRNSGQQQIEVIKQFDAEISAAEARLETLKTSQVSNEGTDSESKKTAAAIAAQKKRDDEAQATSRKIEEVNRTTEKSFDRVTNKISTQFSQSVADVLRGTTTIGGAFQQMSGKMVIDLASSLSRMAIQWVAHYAQHLVMHTATNAAIVGSDAAAAAASTGITAAQSFKQVAHFAAVAAAKAYASLADIPVVGPALGAAAAAATFVGVLAFQSLISAEKGAVVGGSNALAVLHPREMVLPAHLSEGIQGMIGGRTGQTDNSGQSRGGTTNLHYYAPVNVSSEQRGRDAKDMMKLINRETRKGRGLAFGNA